MNNRNNLRPNKMSGRKLRAGIIPFTKIGEKIAILLGKEMEGKWSPFAGGVEDGENIKLAANREFKEEIMGFYRDDEIIPYMRDELRLTIRGRDTTYLYLVPFDYDPNLSNYFSNILSFFSKCTRGKNMWGLPIIPSCPEGYLEKSEIAWFLLDDIRDFDLEERKNVFSARANAALSKVLNLDWSTII